MKLKNLSTLALLGAGLIISNSAFAQWTRVGSKTWLTNVGDSLGIGTTNPGFKVDIQSTGVATMSLKSTTSNANILFDRKGATGTASLTYRTNGVNNWQTGTIGNNNYVLKNNSLNTIALFSEYTTNNIGIGTSTPGAKLEVAGQVKITGGTPGAGKVLTSDANGLASWAVPSTGGLANGAAAGNTPYWNGTTWVTNSSNIFNNGGSVGIGTATPHAPLQFSNGITQRKIVLFETGNNDNEFYGFGINGSTLRYQVDVTGSDHVFYAGASTTTSTELMRIKGTGKVGIGTSTPLARLHVKNGEIITDNYPQSYRLVYGNYGSFWRNDGVTTLFMLTAANDQYGSYNNLRPFLVNNASGTTLIGNTLTTTDNGSFGGGQVAIGGVAPATGYKLTVAGKIICEELKVQLQPFPDYVFADSYNLKSIDEVEQHIKTYSRLPGMPSACEVEEGGLSVGEMTGKVVEKVEENTLYIIQLSKENKELKEQLKAIQVQLNALKK